MEIQKNKRGQAAGAVGAILTGFVTIAAVLVLIVLLVYVFGTVGTGLESTKLANTITNETSVYLNTSSSFRLATAYGGNPRDFVITEINNGTDTIATGNYSVDTITGTLSNLSTALNNLNASYTFNNDSASITATKAGQTNTSRALPLVGTLFIIVAVGALITILMISLMGRRKS